MIFLTGSTGFIGSAIAKKLASLGSYELKFISITNIFNDFLQSGVSCKDFISADNLRMFECDVFIHAAGFSTREYFQSINSKFNLDLTIDLARSAALSGVKRFIFISSVMVNGDKTAAGESFKEDDDPNPLDYYSKSKWEIEKFLRHLSTETGMEVVIIRPPLVYGPNVKGNFEKFVKLIQSGLPLPFDSIDNKRSLIAIDNLVDFIEICIRHPAAANETFIVSDGIDLSTSELFEGVAMALGKSSRLFFMPKSFVIYAALLIGKRDLVERLFSSLQVDIQKARLLLGWTPKVKFTDQLSKMFGNNRNAT